MVKTIGDLTAIPVDNKVILVYRYEVGKNQAEVFEGELSLAEHVRFHGEMGVTLLGCENTPWSVRSSALAYLLLNDKCEAFRVKISPVAYENGKRVDFS